MKKSASIILAIVISLSLVSCEPVPTGTPTIATPKPSWPEGPKKVGIVLPYKAWWGALGDRMKQTLETAGFEVDLQYSSENGGESGEVQSNLQFSHVRKMISDDCKALIISPNSGHNKEWADVLAAAKEKGILVISLDNFLSASDAVRIAVEFDFWHSAGQLQAEYIAKALGLPEAKGPFNIEMFTDRTLYSDDSVPPLWAGAMEVLQPYIDSGQINEPSEEGDYGREGKAAAHMKQLLTSKGYSKNGKKLDAVLCSWDNYAHEVTQALLNAGYAPNDFPIITGSGNDVSSVKSIIAGTQSMTVHSNYRMLVDKAAEIVIAVSRGEKPEPSDTVANIIDHRSGKPNVITAYSFDVIVVTKANYQTLLIDSGYYTEDELS